MDKILYNINRPNCVLVRQKLLATLHFLSRYLNKLDSTVKKIEVFYFVETCLWFEINVQ